jgi:hypothetical protein
MQSERTVQPERRPFGVTTIEVADDEFFNGYQAGYLLYRITPQVGPLTDTGIYNFLCKHLSAVTTTDRFRAGVLSGWYAALYGYHMPAPVLFHQAPVPAAVAGQERQ